MSVHSWGTGRNGELGVGDEKPEALDPVLLDSFRGKHIKKVCCGEFHSVAISELGDLFVWGRGREGQLGNGQKVPKHFTPAKVWTLRHERVVHAVCGYYHCLALTASGKLYQWGKLFRFGEEEEPEHFGMLIGLSGMVQSNESVKALIEHSTNQYYAAGTTEEELEEMKQSKQTQNFGSFLPVLVSTPSLVPSLKKIKIVEMAAGYSFSVAISDKGRVYVWGFNDKFQLGLGHRYNQENPVLVNALKGVRIVSAACGSQHTVLLSDKGELYTCGLGVFGQLGHGVTKDERRPRLVESLLPANGGERIVQVACGSHHTIALGVSGVVWTWGSAEYGQQGGTNAYEDWATGKKGKAAALACSTPRSLAGCFKGKHIVHIACGHLYNIAITREGAVWTWGWGSHGVLGHGNHRFLLVPKQIRRLGGEPIAQVAAGSKHVLAVNSGSSTTFAFDYKVAYNNKQFADLVFVVEGKRFYAHKAIVFSRCWYLRSYVMMGKRFTVSKKEEKEKEGEEEKEKTAKEKEIEAEKDIEVVVDKVRAQIFAAILFYLYTDHLQCPPHIIEEIGRVAKQYRLPRLQGLCQRHGLTEEEAYTFQVPPSTFASDLLKAVHYDTADFTDCADVVFILTNESENEEEAEKPKEFKEMRVMAHKVILSARCEYFKRIFNSGFRESSGSARQGSMSYIPIRGMKPEIFLAMLEYIYTGRVSSKENTVAYEAGFRDIIRPDFVVDLLLASDRFLLDDLKQICEAEIEDSLELENATAILFLGDQANAPRLKRACLDFINSVWKDFEESKSWQELRESSPHLAGEVTAAHNELIAEEDVLEESDEEDEEDEKEKEASDEGKGKEKEPLVSTEEVTATTIQPSMARMPPPLVPDF